MQNYRKCSFCREEMEGIPTNSTSRNRCWTCGGGSLVIHNHVEEVEEARKRNLEYERARKHKPSTGVA